MKKTLSIITSLFLLTGLAKANEIGIGVAGAMHFFDGTGTETTRQSSQKNTGSHSHDVLVPELFVEAISDTGLAIGVSYIPTREMGSKSRSDSNSDGDTGTYTAKAELDNVIQLYTDIPMGDVGNFSIYGKLGVQHATIKTLESLNSGSTYPDEDVLGFTVGLGAKGDLAFGNNLYYKAEATYTDFEDYSADSSAGNKVEAELEDVAVKLSIGYKF